MSSIKITKLSRASLAGVILLIAACLLLSVSQAQAQTGEAQTPASSFADVTLKPGTKLLVILGTGEKFEGKADNISDGTLSIKINTNQTATFGGDYKIRILSESQIFQIFQVKGSRGMGALKGGLIGAAIFTVGVFVIPWGGDPGVIYIPLFAICGAGLGAVIGMESSGEKNILIYQYSAVSPHSGLKTGLLNFSDGRLSFAAPSIYLRPDNSDRFRVKPSKKNTKHINLVKVDF